MPVKLSGKSILLVDDDSVLKTLVSRILLKSGCSVRSSSGIKDALSQITSFSPDLIILDLNMPEHDGFAFLKFRRNHAQLSSVPVLVLSGTKSEEDVLSALELGADQFLKKPVQSHILLQKLEYIFSTRAAYVYEFPDSDLPTLDATLQGNLVEQCIGRLKIEAQVKFCPGKPVDIQPESDLKNKIPQVVCRVDNQIVELKNGFFITVVSATGISPEKRHSFESWQRSLSE